MPSAPATTINNLSVVCLCAEWCPTCVQYRKTVFTTLRAKFPAVKFAWVDIEDHVELVGEDLDIETFPSIVILADNLQLFYGAVLPNELSLSKLIQKFLNENLHLNSYPINPELKQLVQYLAKQNTGIFNF